MDDLLKDYEQDVKDSHQAVLEAEKEIADAQKWHYKMLVNYANDIKRLDDYKKQKDL